jgi:hypothetical protein
MENKETVLKIEKPAEEVKKPKVKVKKEKTSISKVLLKYNSKNYNLHKASEEFQELALVLNQKLLKPSRITDDQIIDEIGDCIIRLEVLKRMFDKKKIKQRIKFKTEAYKTYIKEKRYSKI